MRDAATSARDTFFASNLAICQTYPPGRHFSCDRIDSATDLAASQGAGSRARLMGTHWRRVDDDNPHPPGSERRDGLRRSVERNKSARGAIVERYVGRPRRLRACTVRPASSPP
jgi:hypothetical protein